MRSVYIISSCISFLFGVLTASFLSPDFLICLALIFWAVITFRFNKISALCLAFAALGLFRFWINIPEINESSIHYYADKDVKIIGTVSLEPDRRREKVNYFVDAESLYLNGKWTKVEGRVLVPYDLYPEFEYLQRIEITGFLVAPPEFEGFSYRSYLSLFSVYSIVQRPYIKNAGETGTSLKSILFAMKNGFEYQLNRLFPEPSASFEAGLLTGSRKGIPDELLEAFNITGLTHIIAISGYNISLIIILVSSLFKSSSRKIKVPFVILFIILFTIFVGASAAVVRASIMGIVSVMALWFGRQSKVINALLISAFVMVMWNPPTLLYDVGFQLSFLATLGLIICGNKILAIVSFLPEKFGIREACAMTFSAQVFALPIILVNFGRFSLISPVANVLVVPLIPFAMSFGFISSVFSFIWFDLGFVLAMPAWLILEVASFMTKVLSNFPMASYEIGWFNYFHVVGYYLICVIAYFVYKYFRPVVFRR